MFFFKINSYGSFNEFFFSRVELLQIIIYLRDFGFLIFFFCNIRIFLLNVFIRNKLLDIIVIYFKNYFMEKYKILYIIVEY